jgi:prostaglandin-E synthase 1
MKLNLNACKMQVNELCLHFATNQGGCMSSLSGSTLLAVFAIVCMLLVLKSQILGAATAAVRGKRQKFINREDAAWLGGEHVAADDEPVQRIFRAHRNDLENLLPFFIGGMMYLFSGASAAAGMVYFGLFLLARYTHTYAYIRQRPKLRRNAFTGGWLITIVMSVHAAWATLLTALA